LARIFGTEPRSDLQARLGATRDCSSQRVRCACVLKAGGDAQERGRPPAILRSAVCPRALQLSCHVFWCSFLQRLEHGFRLADLCDADESQHDVAARVNYLGPLSERTRRAAADSAVKSGVLDVASSMALARGVNGGLFRQLGMPDNR
jgi:hypothetical protein